MMIDDLRTKYLEFFQKKQHLIYPSASLKSEDPTLLFTVAGMVQFKPYFLGATPKFAGYDGVWHRVTTAQKCVRVNDIENVGRTLRHHSFFEMMGNFSFGDYFKKEACEWAWEFLTSKEHLGLDPERLYVTVYNEDDEAYAVWRDVVGVPEERISRWGEEENFWPASAVTEGPNGPCGPCSEIFYDRGPGYGTPDETGPNTGSGDRFLEVWNLVFTQFDRQDGGVLKPLPQRNIDTGLGFERLVALMTGSVDAYGSELFQPTIRKVAELSGKPYKGPESVSHRVIADHVRAVTFAVADGIMPDNDGAGYIVKMLLRRAARHAWLLGIRQPVMAGLVDQVIEAMGGAYPGLAAGRERIQGIIHTEEEHFLRTLQSGIDRVRQLLNGLEGRVLPGDLAFDLWQTYGFPLDLTRDMAAEHGVDVDAAGYAAARERAKEASRAGRGSAAMFSSSSDALGVIAARAGETRFTGHGSMSGDATVVAVLEGEEETGALREGNSGTVLLDSTPFYAEGGGQIGDSGKLEWPGGSAVVTGTTRSPQGLHLHRARVIRGTLEAGGQVHAAVDPARRETEKHHSVTHLLHAALRTVLGKHVAQAGSSVTPDRLRFDFSHPAALTQEQIDAVEERVNRLIQQDGEVQAEVLTIDQARERGAMMLFGEKYGHEVRMVSIAPEGAEPVSIELCGGTHVRRTGSIGYFVITEESAVSSGVRRIEARAGMSAVRWQQDRRQTLHSLGDLIGASLDGMKERISRLLEDQKTAARERKQLMDRLAAAQTQAPAGSALDGEAGGLKYGARQLEGLDASALRNAADSLLQQGNLDVAVVAGSSMLVVKASQKAQEQGVKAGQLAGALAARTGGRGGGRPDMAQAGVGDAAKLEAALASLPELLQ